MKVALVVVLTCLVVVGATAHDAAGRGPKRDPRTDGEALLSDDLLERLGSLLGLGGLDESPKATPARVSRREFPGLRSRRSDVSASRDPAASLRLSTPSASSTLGALSALSASSTPGTLPTLGALSIPSALSTASVLPTPSALPTLPALNLPTPGASPTSSAVPTSSALTIFSGPSFSSGLSTTTMTGAPDDMPIPPLTKPDTVTTGQQVYDPISNTIVQQRLLRVPVRVLPEPGWWRAHATSAAPEDPDVALELKDEPSVAAAAPEPTQRPHRSAPGDSNVADASGRLNAAPSAPKQKSTTAGHPDDAELIPITTDTAELNGALEQETEQLLGWITDSDKDVTAEEDQPDSAEVPDADSETEQTAASDNTGASPVPAKSAAAAAAADADATKSAEQQHTPDAEQQQQQQKQSAAPAASAADTAAGKPSAPVSEQQAAAGPMTVNSATPAPAGDSVAVIAPSTASAAPPSTPRHRRPARAANNLIHHRGTNGRVSAAPAVEEPRVMEIIPADKTADGPAGLLPTVTVLADLGGDMDEETEQLLGWVTDSDTDDITAEEELPDAAEVPEVPEVPDADSGSEQTVDDASAVPAEGKKIEFIAFWSDDDLDSTADDVSAEDLYSAPAMGTDSGPSSVATAEPAQHSAADGNIKQMTKQQTNSDDRNVRDTSDTRGDGLVDFGGQIQNSIGGQMIVTDLSNLWAPDSVNDIDMSDQGIGDDVTSNKDDTSDSGTDGVTHDTADNASSGDQPSIVTSLNSSSSSNSSTPVSTLVAISKPDQFEARQAAAAAAAAVTAVKVAKGKPADASRQAQTHRSKAVAAEPAKSSTTAAAASSADTKQPAAADGTDSASSTEVTVASPANDSSTAPASAKAQNTAIAAPAAASASSPTDSASAIASAATGGSTSAAPTKEQKTAADVDTTATSKQPAEAAASGVVVASKAPSIVAAATSKSDAISNTDNAAGARARSSLAVRRQHVKPNSS